MKEISWIHLQINLIVCEQHTSDSLSNKKMSLTSDKQHFPWLER